MDDLQALNKRILAHAGASNRNLETVLNLVSVCFGKLKPSSQELSALLANLPASSENTLDVMSLNKEYLQFARQTARDITSGHFDGLVVLNIDLAQARLLARLTNQQITELSRRCDGLIFETACAATLSVNPLHNSAAPHYSAAMLAAAA